MKSKTILSHTGFKLTRTTILTNKLHCTVKHSITISILITMLTTSKTNSDMLVVLYEPLDYKNIPDLVICRRAFTLYTHRRPETNTLAQPFDKVPITVPVDPRVYT